MEASLRRHAMPIASQPRIDDAQYLCPLYAAEAGYRRLALVILRPGDGGDVLADDPIAMEADAAVVP